MKRIQNYVEGAWVSGKGEGRPLHDAVTGEQIGNAGTEGIDMASALQYGREKGGTALRNMTFYQRGLMLKKLALHLHEKRKEFYPLSYRTGATKADSWVDIEGGIGNLFANASLRRKLGNKKHFVEGEGIDLSRGGNFMGHHIMVPKPGIAVHINAFNFPVWGMLEKIAVNLVAGVPAIVKPATISSFLTESMVRAIIDSEILPEGSLQLLCGSAGDLLEHVESQDVVTFTGSASTGRMLKAHPRIIGESVPFNMEADSLNASILGKDVKPDSEEFKLFVKEVQREICSKAGQKCTAIRRVIVPENILEAVRDTLAKRLDKTVIGNPVNKDVRMGALVGKKQVAEVRERVSTLLENSELCYGDLEKVDVLDADAEKGAFLSPLLMLQEKPFENRKVHEVEAFGPVSTLIPYTELEEAVELANLGKGSLVSSICTYDDKIADAYVKGAASHHGRILILNRESAEKSTGHGSPLPLLIHGGPGRAGGGEEMGGMRGVKHYLQRCAIQGSPTSLTEVTGVYQMGGKFKDSGTHPFRKHFEDLEVGETVVTHKRTITEADIINFANVSWDHFYAHTDTTSLEGTTFDERVAHGYFILSAAAGLFVDPGKGPVLLNYGIEECRFTKPIYAGTTIGVNFTVKEKMNQERKDEDDIGKGIVKFLVEVYDETDETVAVATILTMVKRREQGGVGVV